jgi:biotin-dependent carboxylase-like uncharacterized protein
VIVVERSGLLTTVQDGGRPGLARYGVPPSGAADPRSLAAGNALVGNAPDAAALEASVLGPVLRITVPALVALTGAVTLEPREVERLELGPFTRGARAYVCVRGGIDVEPALGSRSTDLLTGLGRPPLRDGDELRIGPEPETRPQPVEPPELPSEPVLRVLPGPRDEWFASLEPLFAQPWRVSASSNRVGVRLHGPPLARRIEGELLSEGLVTGAIQVPPSGPILLLNDHPTTGGYPVAAVVVRDDLWLAGQLAPGASVRFTVANVA